MTRQRSLRPFKGKAQRDVAVSRPAAERRKLFSAALAAGLLASLFALGFCASPLSAAPSASDTVVDDGWADTEAAAVEGLPIIPEARGTRLRIG